MEHNTIQHNISTLQLLQNTARNKTMSYTTHIKDTHALLINKTRNWLNKLKSSKYRMIWDKIFKSGTK